MMIKVAPTVENGSVGGYMVKKIIEAQERQMTNIYGGLRRPTARKN